MAAAPNSRITVGAEDYSTRAYRFIVCAGVAAPPAADVLKQHLH